MQVPDDRKRRQILEAATRLFSQQPFHKVLLSDVAEAAKVGKGTLYIYFKDKEDLFASVIRGGFEQLVERLREHGGDQSMPPRQALRVLIAEIVKSAYGHPRPFELMRMFQEWGSQFCATYRKNAGVLASVIESVIRRGVAEGSFVDPRPALTARLIPGMIRSAMMEPDDALTEDALIEHLIGVVEAWLIAPQDRACEPKPRSAVSHRVSKRAAVGPGVRSSQRIGQTPKDKAGS